MSMFIDSYFQDWDKTETDKPTTMASYSSSTSVIYAAVQTLPSETPKKGLVVTPELMRRRREVVDWCEVLPGK